MGKLRDQMLADLQLCGAKPRTQETYLREAENLARYFNRSPAELGEAELKEYLLYLIKERHLSEGTFRFYVAGLKFLYRTTLKRNRLTNSSFLPLFSGLCFPTMKNLHHWEAKDDQSGTAISLAHHHREPGDKRHKHCGLLSGCPDQAILFLYVAAQAQGAAATVRRGLPRVDSRQTR